jgi:integrase
MMEKLMNVKYYLNSPEKEDSAIMLYMTFTGKRIRMSTGISIPSRMWDSKNCKLKSSYQYSLEINSKLSEITSKIENEYIRAIHDKVEDIHTFIKRFIDELINDKVVEEINLDNCLETFIAQREKDPNFSKGIIRIYRVTKNKIIEYCKSTGKNYDFELFNEEFYTSFCDYLGKENKNNNTVGRYVKTLKTMLRYCYDNGFLKSHAFSKYKVWRNDADTIALNEEELKLIEEVDLKKVKSYEYSRSIFLLQCYTGLRFGDLLKIKPEHVNWTEGYIRVITEKTRESVFIPLHDKLISELKHFFAFDCKPMSNVLVNRFIKKVCEKAGIEDLVEKTDFKNKVRERNSFKKWELITTHTGRRTYITLSLKKGAMPEMVMKISGHKDRDTFQKYVRLSQNETLDAMKNIWNK